MAGVAGVTRLSVGGSAQGVCALLDGGVVECWGRDDSGQLGTGASGSIVCDAGPCAAPAPVVTSTSPVVALTGATAVATGRNDTCALMADSTVRCWGLNDLGELGNGTYRGSGCGGLGCSAVATPVLVTQNPPTPLRNVTSIAVGFQHACAVLADTTVVCWGANYYGQLGVGTTSGPGCANNGCAVFPAPVQANGTTAPLTGAVEVAAGDYHTCARLTDGTVACWGLDDQGQLGFGGIGGPGCGNVGCNTSAYLAHDLAGVVALAAGGDETCAALADATVACWGEDTFGEIGDGVAGAAVTVPIAVSSLGDVTAISVGDAHACALVASGAVGCWGANQAGELAVDGGGISTTPVQILGL
jgi:alpha-tubulin suppressor-like RCC1 family protein